MKQDGRKLRGELQKQKLIAATLSIIEKEGIAEVTHRKIANIAVTSASSVVYYFPTIDDLLYAALVYAAEEYANKFKYIISKGNNELYGIAEIIAEASGVGRQRAIAERELTLQAARRPILRSAAQHWRKLVAQVALKYSNDPLKIQAFVAATDGICAKALLEETPISTDDVYILLNHILKD
ncbi:TetR/AcrR family transcriptional regulator [Acinetobacter puyangensis]|uniref:TetR/AcrR family transcriptional regulator n=1 Tax=Acinetobacter puyangensis TaxID=1096779 RepID=UPI003A4D3434